VSATSTSQDTGKFAASVGGDAAESPALNAATMKHDAWAWMPRLAVPVLGGLLCFVFSLLTDDFLSRGNFTDILNSAALPVIVAVALTLCLVIGEFDLSIAATSGLSTMVVSVLAVRHDWTTASAVTAALLVSIAIGTFNGISVAYFGMNALIVTIAMSSILNGIEFLISGSTQIFGGYPPEFIDFGRGKLGPLSNLVWVAMVIVAGCWLLLDKTSFGRHMRAVGGNDNAAYLMGVKVRRLRLTAFALCGGLVGLAGVLYAARQGSAYPLTGLNVLLPSFAAAFIGAATIRVGEFNVLGTVIGVLVIQISANGLLLLNVPSYATYIFHGTILFIALLFARLVTRGQRR